MLKWHQARNHTLHLLTDIERPPPNPVRELSPEMLEFIRAVPFCTGDEVCSESEDITQET